MLTKILIKGNIIEMLPFYQMYQSALGPRHVCHLTTLCIFEFFFSGVLSEVLSPQTAVKYHKSSTVFMF